MVSAIHARTALFWALKVDVRGSVTILCYFRSNDTSPKTNAVLKEKTLIAVRPAAPHAVPALCQMGYLQGSCGNRPHVSAIGVSHSTADMVRAALPGSGTSDGEAHAMFVFVGVCTCRRF